MFEVCKHDFILGGKCIFRVCLHDLIPGGVYV